MAAKKPVKRPTSAKKKPAAKPAFRRLGPEERRHQIIEAARTVFLKRPDATLDEVAKEAGVTRQLISLYFPGGGTGPIYGAMFDQYIVKLPAMMGEDLIAKTTSKAQIRTRAERVIKGFLDWAEEIGEPWVFEESSSNAGAAISARWRNAFELTVEALLPTRPKGVPVEKARLVFLSELTGFNAVTARMLAGKCTRADAETVLVEGFVAIYTVVLPKLASA